MLWHRLIGAARERVLAANQGTAKDLIYQYVTGQEFGMQVRAIAEAFARLKSDMDKERQAMERIWKSREKQLEVVLGNISGIRGSLGGFDVCERKRVDFHRIVWYTTRRIGNTARRRKT